MMLPTLILALTATLASAHTGAFAPGMYCRGGPTDADDNNTNTVVNPLGDLTKSDWWFQNDRGCTEKPPPAGEFLELPAGKEFTVELAHNRAFTTLSYEGKFVTDWPDGQAHPEDYAELTPGACLTDGALHTNNRSTAAGTAWAISYESDLSKVTMENLVVFSVLEHTPWKRLATYQVPANMPACPPGGCTCAWLWVPLLCGISNMYMQGFKCNVTGATSTVPLAQAQAPVFCEGDQSKCVKGAKQMIAWNQKDGNNIVTKFPVAPGYNMKCGWKSGAQNDIFAAVLPSSPATSSLPVIKSTTTSTIPSTLSTSLLTSSTRISNPSASPSTSLAGPSVSSILPSTSSIKPSTSLIEPVTTSAVVSTPSPTTTSIEPSCDDEPSTSSSEPSTTLVQPTTSKTTSVTKTTPKPTTVKTSTRVKTTTTNKTRTTTKRTRTSTRTTATPKTTRRRHSHGRATHA